MRDLTIPESGWDARKIIRCRSCHHKYKAERLIAIKVDSMLKCEAKCLDELIEYAIDHEYSGTLFVVYAECPECYALHGAEFSLS